MRAYDKHSDKELILFLKESDQRAMTELFDRYWHKLLAVALNRLDNLEEAEECVQDVFLKLWKLRTSLELKYSLNTYLSAAVKYRVFDLLDKRYRKGSSILKSLDQVIDVGSELDMPDTYLLERELIEIIAAATQQLPEKCQIVYRMSRDEGRTHKQIANELDISVKTVEAHLTKAIKHIRGNLDAEFPAVITMLCWYSIYNRL